MQYGTLRLYRYMRRLTLLNKLFKNQGWFWLEEKLATKCSESEHGVPEGKLGNVPSLNKNQPQHMKLQHCSHITQ